MTAATHSGAVEDPATMLALVQEKIDEAQKRQVHMSTGMYPMLSSSSPLRELYQRRRLVIDKIPTFWLSVLLNHPAFTFLVTSADTRMLHHLTDIDVRPVKHTSHPDDFEVVFAFTANPFFSSASLAKRYVHADENGRVVHVAPIAWKSPPASLLPDSSLDSTDLAAGFFDWLSNDHSDSSHLGELIRDQIFPHAIELYFGTYPLAPSDSEQITINNVH